MQKLTKGYTKAKFPSGVFNKITKVITNLYKFFFMFSESRKVACG